MAKAFLRLDTHAQLNLLQNNNYHIKCFSHFQYMKDTFLKSSNKAGHFPFLGITELFTLVHIKLQQNPHTDYRAVAG